MSQAVRSDRQSATPARRAASAKRKPGGLDAVRAAIRDVPDFPKKGILFRDITPVIRDPRLFGQVVDAWVKRYRSRRIDAVAAVESRGYILAAPLALRLGAAFIPIRKAGKLPCEVRRIEYSLEYGTGVLEMHTDAIQPGQKVLVLDDVLATGGTAWASGELVRQAGGDVVEATFFIELAALGGRRRLEGTPVHSLLTL